MAADTMWVVGGVSAETGKPYVEIQWGDHRGQYTVEDARKFSINVQEACANAVCDAALFSFATDELKLDVARAAGMIDGVRHHRVDRWGQPDLESEFREPTEEAM